MERAYMPLAEPPPLKHMSAPDPKAAVAGPTARTARIRPFSVTQLRIRNGSSCPFADLRIRD